MEKDFYTKNEIIALLQGATIPTTDGTRDFFTKTETDQILESASGGGVEICENGYFSTNQRYVTNIAFDNTDLSSYEIVVCFRLKTTPTTVNPFFGANAYWLYAPVCEINTSGVLQGFSSNGNSLTYQTTTALSDTPIMIGDDMQFIKLTWTLVDNRQSLFHSTDAATWTEISSVTTAGTPFSSYEPSLIAFGGSGRTSVFSNGDINIFNSYIKINDVLLWGAEI
jgi:hypothetical protein